jgi:hypothetical protein
MPEPEKVCVPVLEVKVPPFEKFPPKVMTAAADSVQVPWLFMITSPENVFAPVALVKVIVPFIVVVDETANVNAPTESDDPKAILKFEQAAAAAIVTVNPPSINTSSPAMGTVAPDAPPEDADHVLVEPQLPVATE